MSKELQQNQQTVNGPEETSYLAPHVMPKVQSKIQPKVTSKIQAKLLNGAGEKKEQKQQTSGSDKLPEEVQAKMENSFSQDFSNVNIHKDSSSAQDINAKAYTQGSDVHFAPGEYNPSSKEGQELIGHELTHVVQQGQGKVGPGEIHGKGLEINQNVSLEKEADDAGKLASEGKSVEVSGVGSGVQRKEGEGEPKINITVEDNTVTDDVVVSGMTKLGTFSYIDSFTQQRVTEFVLTGSSANWAKILKYADSGPNFRAFILGFLKASNDPAWIVEADSNPFKQEGKIVDISRAPNDAEKLEFLKALYGAEGESELDLVDAWHEKGLGSLEEVTTPELAEFVGKHQHILVNYMSQKSSEQHLASGGVAKLAEQGTFNEFNPVMVQNMVQSAFSSALSATKLVIAQSMNKETSVKSSIDAYDMVVNSAIILKTALDSYGKSIKSLQDGFSQVFDLAWAFVLIPQSNVLQEVSNAAKEYLKAQLIASMKLSDTENMKEQYVLKYTSFVKEACIRAAAVKPEEIDQAKLSDSYKALISGFKSNMSS